MEACPVKWAKWNKIGTERGWPSTNVWAGLYMSYWQMNKWNSKTAWGTCLLHIYWKMRYNFAFRRRLRNDRMHFNWFNTSLESGIEGDCEETLFLNLKDYICRKRGPERGPKPETNKLSAQRSEGSSADWNGWLRSETRHESWFSVEFIVPAEYKHGSHFHLASSLAQWTISSHDIILFIFGWKRQLFCH